jgi:hypothetical protein
MCDGIAAGSRAVDAGLRSRARWHAMAGVESNLRSPRQAAAILTGASIGFPFVFYF